MLSPDPSELREFRRGSQTSVYAVYDTRSYVTSDGRGLNIQNSFSENAITYTQVRPPVITAQRFQSGLPPSKYFAPSKLSVLQFSDIFWCQGLDSRRAEWSPSCGITTQQKQSPFLTWKSFLGSSVSSFTLSRSKRFRETPSSS